MNIAWILANLREAHDELTRMIATINDSRGLEQIEFQIALAHIYDHLNTAWNSRAAADQRIAAMSDEDFYTWRAFPSDISMD
jgi:hypothetical protein